MTKQQETVEALERIVDAEDVGFVLRCLGLVCQEKAEHLLVNWQDKAAAKRWERAGDKIMAFSDTKPILDVEPPK